MSPFIHALAFPGGPALVEEAKIGILVGSILSAAAGSLLLRLAPLHRDQPKLEPIGEMNFEQPADREIAPFIDEVADAPTIKGA